MIEERLKRNIIFEGKIIKVYLDDIKLENNKNAKREIVEHNGGAGILALKDNKILLIKQYRYAFNDYLLEIPAGKLELNEDPKVCAIRELEEETGLKPLEMNELITIIPTCGYSTEKIYIYYTNSFIKTHTNFDEDEDIKSTWYSLDEALELINKGLIEDAKTIVAIQTYILYKKIA